MTRRVDLLNLDSAEMTGLLAGWGEPVYRVKQVQHALYRELVDSFEAMTNLPQTLRARLQAETTIGTLTPLAIQDSADGLTRKVLFQLDDGETIETVLMRYADAPGSPENSSDAPTIARRTVCLSTQVGCPIGCPFCATGQVGYVRNLTVGEILAQVLYFARQEKRAGHLAKPLTNIVFMGMGEPLLKFDVTWRALEALMDPARFGMGARRITVSTAGVVPGICQLTEKRSQVNLAVSLHAADDALRDVLVPINRKYPLRELLAACRAYTEVTHRRVTFEYALMEGINDKPEDARRVAQLLQGLLCHVNLIPLNPTGDARYRRPSYARVQQFERSLRERGIPTTLRVEKGIEIAAGCGQLRQRAAQAPSVRAWAAAV